MAESTSTDRQDIAERLDRDEIVTDPDFTGDRPTDYPPDRPSAALDEAPDAADEAYGETLDERMARERPDPLAEELTPPRRTDSDAPATADDDGLGAFAPTDDVFADLDDDEVARLDTDRAIDLAAGDAPSARRVAARTPDGAPDEPAEEQAVHVID